MPLVSIIMGVCYRKKNIFYLKRAITSILMQSYSNWELLICENGSTDEAIEYIRSQVSEDSRVRLVDGKCACTLAEKLNRCIACASGDWIARMDDDDWCVPERIEDQVKFLLKHHKYVAVGCWVKEIDSPNTRIRILPLFPDLKDFRVTFPFVHPALLLRKQPLLEVEGYSQSPRQNGCDDYDLMLRLYQRGYRAANLQKVLLHYSIESSQLKHRPYILFWNEAVTRFKRFREMGLLPAWLPWVIKPLVVGIIPRRLLYQIKARLKT